MKILKKILKILVALLAILLVVFLLGPKVERPELSQYSFDLPESLTALEQKINTSEDQIPNIRPDNEARIIWADSVPKKTAYSIVYLHGWSASQEEGDPIHTQTAKAFGFNLYLPRLAGHGLIEEEPMLDLSAEELLKSAQEALAIGKQLGDKVILMGTSTGGTLALELAARNPEIAALLLYSPNVEIFDSSAQFLVYPWGLELAQWIKGSNYHEFDTDIALKNQYWTTKYRLEALTQLQALLAETMTEDNFQTVKQPVFLGYYYKDEQNQDNVVSVPAMLEMYDQLGTAMDKKVKLAFPEAGDHVMTSYVTSKALEAVQEETNNFLTEFLGLEAKTD